MFINNQIIITIIIITNNCHEHFTKTSFYLGYVDELLNLLFNEVLHDPAPFVEQLKAVSVPQPLCSQYERPEKGEVIANYVSRFSRPGMA